VTRETNLGLFKGEATNTLHWDPNPWNNRFEIVSYAVYRQPANGSTAFQRIATVSSNATAYVDQGLGFDDLYAYAVRAVDAEGNESPISQVARN
jgi:fibronectin type 3 domain-containing protein